MNHLNPTQWLRSMYVWVLSLAKHRWAYPLLAFIAFIESIFFPIPADVMLIALLTSDSKKAFKAAFITTIFSVLGGVGGYWIGASLWDAFDSIFFEHILSEEKFHSVVSRLEASAFLAIFIAGFTPIPYKAFTIAAGVMGVNFPVFILASICSRGLRFFLIGTLFYFFGEAGRRWIDQHFEKVTYIIGALLIIILCFYFL